MNHLIEFVDGPADGERRPLEGQVPDVVTIEVPHTEAVPLASVGMAVIYSKYCLHTYTQQKVYDDPTGARIYQFWYIKTEPVEYRDYFEWAARKHQAP